MSQNEYTYEELSLDEDKVQARRYWQLTIVDKWLEHATKGFERWYRLNWPITRKYTINRVNNNYTK